MKKVIRTPDFPIVQTMAGKLHGFMEDNVCHYYGIKYGDAERFSLPKPVKTWDGIRDAKSYGYVCPLMAEELQVEDNTDSSLQADSFEMPHRYWPESENCLYLNIWTKHINDESRKPVLVWLHGGGYSNGSSVEIPAYDGHNLCNHGDVVVVNLNHRLNCIGFLDLSRYGEEYKYSGIVGMADIVIALQWVHENISSFGGDPCNVTVAGQSGGGGKAVNLLQMPAADGLYQRIIIESGAFRSRKETNLENKLHWQELGQKTIEILGYENSIDAVRTVDYNKLSKAAVQAGEKLGYPGGMMLFEPSPVEGYYTGLYNEAGFREETKNIPVLCGNVLGEFSFMHYLGDKSQYSHEEKMSILRKQYSEDTDRVVTLFQKIYPGKDILYSLSVDALFRPGAVDFMKTRSSYTDAPVYNFILSIIYPYLGGIVPWHCSEIPLVFRNANMEPLQCTCFQYVEKLETEMSDAWLSFMKSDNPSFGNLLWKPFTKTHQSRMVFDEVSAMTDEDDSELLGLISGHMQVEG